ncbi:MAG: PhnD/SsuA/transferrin family substrate-binding protein [Arthrobacter sp.]|jgi:putative tricarboxylic transport membrane protein|nr:PhnD/SsuA/transferrin family substrate-binding protein [Arthrobacter sp.]
MSEEQYRAPEGVELPSNAPEDIGVEATRQRPPWQRNLGRLAFAVIAVASIATATAFSFASGSSGADPRANLTLIAPAGVGGGWDSFAREQQQAMRGGGVVNNVQVVNIPGAGGTIGLAAFVEQDQDTQLLATGAAMHGGIVINDSPVNMEDVRPIARIAEDYSVFIVPKDSPYSSASELAEAWSKDPRKVRFTGGSAGSIDHLLVTQFAQTLGIPGKDITYLPKSGGGEAMQTILAGTADVAVTGYNEVADQIEVGRIKALAVSAPQRLAGTEIPTFEEEGYAVNLVNWRGFVAAPGVSDEQFDQLSAIVKETSQSEQWKDALARNRWVDSYLDGDELKDFLREDQERTAALIKELGL